MVPAAIQVPIRAPTEIRIRIAGMARARASTIPACISLQPYPSRRATPPATAAAAIRRSSTG